MYLITYYHDGRFYYAISDAVCSWLESVQSLDGDYFLVHAMLISQAQAFKWSKLPLKGLVLDGSHFPTHM